jgi:lipoate-protein ligase A
MLAPGQLLETGDLDGPLNMAIDEVLWEAAARGGAFLRFYGWDRPTLSIGYFQSAAEVRERPEWRSIPFVRRVTGGGAILHDRDLTYSLSLPAAPAPGTDELYERFHRAVMAALGELGVPTTIGERMPVVGISSPEHPSPLAPLPGEDRGAAESLCFRRSDRFALRVGGHKILGSAQRRRRESVLMQGSLLVRTSPLAADLPGIEQILGRPPARLVLTGAISRAALNLQIDFRPAPLPQNLRQRAARLAEEKYRAAAWNERR